VIYWLYVVEDALSEPKIYTIENPAEKFRNTVRKIPITDYRYLIEDWKKTYHGSGFKARVRGNR